MRSSPSVLRPGGRSPRTLSLLVSCEHGGARVPAAYRSLFVRADGVLASHRGQDVGAYALALALARRFDAPLHASRTTRLLVDLNRSLGHRRLYSEYSAPLSAADKTKLLARHYHPYRNAVEAAIAAAIAAGRRLVHVSAHSFTPVYEGHTRTTDIGLLYDPARREERAFASAWREALVAARPDLTVHRNAPYRGVADGLVTHLRRRFRSTDYVGIELELNQRFVTTPGFHALLDAIVDALARAGPFN